jgi:hypothetical protein
MWIPFFFFVYIFIFWIISYVWKKENVVYLIVLSSENNPTSRCQNLQQLLRQSPRKSTSANPKKAKLASPTEETINRSGLFLKPKDSQPLNSWLTFKLARFIKKIPNLTIGIRYGTAPSCF